MTDWCRQGPSSVSSASRSTSRAPLVFRGARGRPIKAVDGISLTIEPGETLGLVGSPAAESRQSGD